MTVQTPAIASPGALGFPVRAAPLGSVPWTAGLRAGTVSCSHPPRLRRASRASVELPSHKNIKRVVVTTRANFPGIWAHVTALHPLILCEVLT